MFKTRLISGIVLVILAFLTINAGGFVLAATLLLISIIGIKEMLEATNINLRGNLKLHITAYVMAIIYYISIVFGFYQFSLMSILGGLIILMIVYVFSYPSITSDKVMKTFFGVIYVGVMLSFILLTRLIPGGKITVWLIFLSAWGCDTMAYCTGMLIGKHKMSPALSPKKTIEGAIGGILGAGILGIIYALIVSGNPFIFAIITMVGGALSMIGDLGASAIKRNNNIKDYGNLIPGHGGIMDRFDSVIFVAPIIYYLLRILQ